MNKKIINSIMMGLLLVGVSSCSNKNVKPATCTSDAECKYTENGQDIEGICYFGKCQQCVKDSDCRDSQACVANQCLNDCESDLECQSGAYCGKSKVCIENCSSEKSCSEGEACISGRCVAGFAACQSNTDCAEGFGCDSGLCSKAGVYQMAMNSECQSDLRIHFDFNKFQIKGSEQSVAKKAAECLKANPNAKLRVEGHTDDRGSTEYNLSLGDKRARALKTHLARLGIDPNRVSTISYGSEKPLSREKNEAAWSMNRRDDILIQD